MRRAFCLLCACACALAAAAQPAAAQWQANPPSMTAEAVLLAPLTGGALNHLMFGAINPGASSQVFASVAGAPNESAGKWAVTVSNNTKRVWVAFVMPTVLTHSTYAGQTIPISFDFAQSGALCEFKNNQCMNFTTFNASQYPHPTGLEHALVNRPSIAAVHVYLGGLVQVPQSARAGTYTATVTLRFATANN